MSKTTKKPKTKRLSLDLDADIYDKLEKRAEKWAEEQAKQVEPFSVQDCVQN